MTIEEFAIQRYQELLAFFEARFGRRQWRQIVSQQVGLNPRTFQRWRTGRMVRRWRKLERLETWARSVGFSSAVDAEVQDSIRRLEEFQEAAAAQRDEEERKRKEAPPEIGTPEWHRYLEFIDAAMKRASAGGESP
jgi:hypothetical protein